MTIISTQKSNQVSNFLAVEKMNKYKKLFQQLYSEFLGTFLFLSLVLSSGIDFGANNANVVIALAHGFIVATIVQIFGHVSGSHINPAVTAGALVCGHIKPVKAVCYVLMHVLGSIAGELCCVVGDLGSKFGCFFFFNSFIHANLQYN